MTPSLSAVIPVYNEPHWIGRTVADLVTAIERSSFDDAEIVIVDDGSDRETKDALAALDVTVPLRVLAQENKGRYLARKAGIEAARGELVLLLDSRVSLDPDGLGWVAGEVEAGRRVWNGYCLIDTEGNPYAQFWDVLTRAAYAEYLDDPRTTSYGIEEYDRFPKGTTHFLAPRQYLLDAIDAFTSRYEDMHLVNDDTRLLRHIAARERINISPRFGSLYQSRTALRPFLKHAMWRGSTFFDGWPAGSRFFPVVVAVFPASLAALVVALRRPLLALIGAASAPAAAAGIARLRWRRGWSEVAAFALLAAPFGVSFVLGMWRGLVLSVVTRSRR